MEETNQQSALLSPTLLSPTDYNFRHSFSSLLRKSRSSSDVPKSFTSGSTTPTAEYSADLNFEDDCDSTDVDNNNKAKQSVSGFSLRSILRKKSFSTVSDDVKKQGFPSRPSSKTPKAERPTDGFDELVLSDKTVKLTLTSDRMRKIEKNNFCFNPLDFPKKPKLPSKKLNSKPELVIDTGKKSQAVVPVEALNISNEKLCKTPSKPDVQHLTSPVIVVNSTISDYLPSPTATGLSWMDDTLDSIREADKEVERVLEGVEKSPSIEIARRVCIKVAKVVTLRSSSIEGRPCLSPKREPNNVAPVLLSKELETPSFIDDLSSDDSSPPPLPPTNFFRPQVTA